MVHFDNGGSVFYANTRIDLRAIVFPERTAGEVEIETEGDHRSGWIKCRSGISVTFLVQKFGFMVKKNLFDNAKPLCLSGP
jgi:hypothetical protein